MKVPRLGYDGSCFPKDVEAFANFTDSEILKKVIEVNENLISITINQLLFADPRHKSSKLSSNFFNWMLC